MWLFQKPEFRDDGLPRFGTAHRTRGELIEDGSKIPRELIGARNGLACNGMGKRDAPRMQELTIESQVGTAGIAPTVQRVAHQGVIDMAHMNTNLMRATGIQMALNERIAVIATCGLKTFEDAKRRDGLAGKRIIGDGHLYAIAR